MQSHIKGINDMTWNLIFFTFIFNLNKNCLHPFFFFLLPLFSSFLVLPPSPAIPKPKIPPSSKLTPPLWKSIPTTQPQELKTQTLHNSNPKSNITTTNRISACNSHMLNRTQSKFEHASLEPNPTPLTMGSPSISGSTPLKCSRT